MGPLKHEICHFGIANVRNMNKHLQLWQKLLQEFAGEIFPQIGKCE